MIPVIKLVNQFPRLILGGWKLSEFFDKSNSIRQYILSRLKDDMFWKLPLSSAHMPNNDDVIRIIDSIPVPPGLPPNELFDSTFSLARQAPHLEYEEPSEKKK